MSKADPNPMSRTNLGLIFERRQRCIFLFDHTNELLLRNGKGTRLIPTVRVHHNHLASNIRDAPFPFPHIRTSPAPRTLFNYESLTIRYYKDRLISWL